MRRALARNGLPALVAQSTRVDVVQEVLAGAEQNRSDREMQLVDQPGAQELSDCGHASAQPDVAVARGGLRLLERGPNSVGNEIEYGAALHRDRRPRMMREHEYRNMIGRLLAPPALPALVGPGTADRAEHVAPQDPGTDPAQALLRDLVVDSGFAVGHAVHLPPGAGLEEPLHQLRAACAERIVDVLVRAGAEAVDGDGEGGDAKLGAHDLDRGSRHHHALLRRLIAAQLIMREPSASGGCHASG